MTTLIARSGHRSAALILTIIAACVVAVNFAIWATVCPATGEFIHPWWLYVAAPPGAVLGVLYAAGIGRPQS